MNHIRCFLKNRAGKLIACALVMQLVFPLYGVRAVVAQVISDPNAPVQFRPVINTVRNVNVIDIVKPDAIGISHNKYQRFDVDSKGLVFNNSLQDGNSRLAGELSANPQLSQPASTILNEVTGASDSQLQGVMEIFGKRANIIIANPNGITCNKCGFINTGRMTLTTGLPRFVNGQLTLDVEQGIIKFEGDGINHRFLPSYLDVFSRYIDVNAEVYTRKELNLIAGQYIVDYQNLATGQAADTYLSNVKSDSKDHGGRTLAIDASAFGAMQSGKINIMGLESGLGVKSDGYLFSQVDDLFIQSAGKVQLRNADAVKKMNVQAKGDLHVSDDLIANQEINLSGNNISTSDKTSFSSRKINISAQGATKLEGKYQSLQSSISSDRLNLNKADVIAVNSMDIQSGSTSIVDSKIRSSLAYIKSSEFSASNVKLNAKKLKLESAGNSVLNTVDIDATEFNWSGANLKSTLSDISSDLVRIKASGSYDETQSSTVSRNTQLFSDSLTSRQSTWVYETGTFNIKNAANADTLKIYGKNTLISATNWQSGNSLILSENIHFDIKEKFSSNSDVFKVLDFYGSKKTGNEVRIKANSGELLSSKVTSSKLNFDIDKLVVSSGRWIANDISLTSSDANITDSQLKASGKIALDSSRLAFSGKTDSADLVVKGQESNLSGEFLTDNADISSNITRMNKATLSSKNLTASIDDLYLTESNLNVDDVNISASQSVNVNSSSWSGDKLSVKSSTLITDGTSKLSGNTIMLDNSQIDNKGEIVSAKSTTINADDIKNNGKIASFDHLKVKSKTLANHQNSSLMAKNLNVQSGKINNSGKIGSDKQTILYSQFFNEKKGIVSSTHSIMESLSGADSLINNEGEMNFTDTPEWKHQGKGKSVFINTGLLTGKDLSFSGLDQFDNGIIDASGHIKGKIVAKGEVKTDSKQFNQYGKIKSDSLVINRKKFVNDGDIETVAINYDGDSFSNKGQINTNDFHLKAKTIENANGSKISTKQLSVSAGQFKNSGEYLFNNGVFSSLPGSPGTGIFDNSGSIRQVVSAKTPSGNIAINGFKTLLNKGVLKADDTIKIDHVSDIQNLKKADGNNAEIYSKNSTEIAHSDTLNNSGLIRSDNLKVSTGTLTNAGIIGTDQGLVSATSTLTNSGNIYQTRKEGGYGVLALSAKDIETTTQSTIELGNGVLQLAAGGGRLSNQGLITNITKHSPESRLAIKGLKHLINTGTLQATESTTVNNGSIKNIGQDSTLVLAGLTANNLASFHNEGVIKLKGQGKIAASTFDNKGSVYAENNGLSAEAQTLTNTGTLWAKDHLAINQNTSGSINNSGYLYGSNVSIGNATHRQLSVINSGRDITSPGKTVQGGIRSGTGDLLLVTKEYTDNSGQVSSAKALTLNSQNDINLKGLIEAKDKIDLSSNNLTVTESGAILSGGGNSRLSINNDLTVIANNGQKGQILLADNSEVSSKNINNSGLIQSSDQLKLTIANSLNNLGGGRLLGKHLNVAAQNLDNKGDLIAQQTQTLNVSNLTNQGRIQAKDLRLHGHTLNNQTAGSQKGEIVADRATIKLGSGLNNSGLIYQNKNTLNSDRFIVDANNLVNSGTVEVSRGQFTAKSLDNSGTIQERRKEAHSSLVLTGLNNLTNSGKILTSTDLNISNGSLINQKNAVLESNRINAQRMTQFSNAGNILTANSLTVSSQSAGNSGNITSRYITLNTNNNFSNNGNLVADESLTVKAASITNNGNLDAKSVALEARENLLNNKLILAKQSMNLSARNITNNRSGEIATTQASSTMRIAASGTISNLNNIDSKGNATFTAGSVVNRNKISARNQATIHTPNLNNTGLIYGGNLNIGKSNQNTTIGSTGVSYRSNTGGAGYEKNGLLAKNQLNLYVRGVLNSAFRGQDINLNASQSVRLDGEILAGRKLNITAPGFDISTSGRATIGEYGGESVWNISGKFVNSGKVKTGSSIKFIASNIDNRSSIYSKSNIKFLTGTLDNRGDITSLGNMDVRKKGGSSVFNNYIVGKVVTNGDFFVDVYSMNNSGSIRTVGSADWNFGSLHNASPGLISVGGLMRYGGNGVVTNQGKLYAGQIDMNISHLINSGSSAQLVAFKNGMSISAVSYGQSILNENRAFIFSKGDVNFSINGYWTNFSKLETFGNLSFSGSRIQNGDENHTGEILVNKDFNVNRGYLLNIGYANEYGPKRNYEAIYTYAYDNWTEKEGPKVNRKTRYYWEHKVGYVNEDVYSSSYRSFIQAKGNLNVSNGNLVNKISDITVGGNGGYSGNIYVSGRLENKTLMQRMTVYNLVWDRKTNNNKAHTNHYAAWLTKGFHAKKGSRENLEVVNHLKSELYKSGGKFYWNGPWGRYERGHDEADTATADATKRRIANGLIAPVISATGTITARGDFVNTGTVNARRISTRDNFNNTSAGNINLTGFNAKDQTGRQGGQGDRVAKSSDNQSNASEKQSDLKQAQVSSNRDTRKNEGKFINGVGDNTVVMASRKPTASINLLAFFAPNLSFEALSEASIDKKGKAKLAEQEKLQQQLNKLVNSKHQSQSIISNGQGQGHSRRSPSLFDLDPSILKLVIADTEYELEPDYLIQRLKPSQKPSVKPKFFLDPYQEAQLITKAAIQQTGKAFFSPDWSTSKDQRRGLYDNAVAYMNTHTYLKLGNALTRSQLANLQKPMIWYVSMNIGGQEQLVPTVYLPQATLKQITTPGVGTLVADSMDIKTGTFKNTGNMKVKNKARIDANVITNQRNVMTFGDGKNQNTVAGEGGNISAGSLELISKTDINNNGGSIDVKKDLVMDAKGNINLRALALKRRSQGGQNIDESTEFVLSKIKVGGNAKFKAGGDFNSEAAQADIGGNASIDAKDINMLGVTERKYQKRHSKHKGRYSSSESTSEKETKTFKGSSFKVGGNMAMKAKNDIKLVGTKVDAKGNIKLKAGNNVTITAGISEDRQSSEETRSGIAKTSTHKKGYVKQSAVGSVLKSGGSLSIDSDGGDVAILGSDISAKKNIVLGKTKIKRDKNGRPILDKDGQYITEGGKSIRNLTIGSVKLKDESWDEKESGFKGPIKKLAAAATAAVAASLSATGMDKQLNAIGVKTDITYDTGSSEKTRTTRTHYATSKVAAGGNFVARVDGELKVEGSQVDVKGNSLVEAKKVTITAVEETTTTTHSESRHSAGNVKPTVGKQEVTVAGVQQNSHTSSTTTSQSTLKKAGFNVGGNSVMKARENVEVLASDVNIKGNSRVKAKKIKVAGLHETSTTEHKERNTHTEVTAGVRNAYVDTAYAAKAVADAGARVNAAKTALSRAKRLVNEGRLAPSALNDYKANLLAATNQLQQATIALGQQGATAAGSTATLGFQASGNAQRTVSEQSYTQTSQRYVGSSFKVGGTAVFDAEDSIDILGSDLTAKKGGVFKAKTVNFGAGTDTTSNTSQNRSKTLSGSYSTGGNSAQVSASVSQGGSRSGSTRHVNSNIQVGNLTIKADKLTVAGANVASQGDVDIEVDELDVRSLQDTSYSSSHSKSASVSGSVGSGGVMPTGVGGSKQNSHASRQWVGKQTSLIGATSGNGKVRIRAKRTNLKGAVIASAKQNEDGSYSDNGNLDMVSDQINVSDIHDSDTSHSQGFNLQTSSTSGNNGQYDSGSTTVGVNRSGHRKTQTTFAGLGKGNIRNSKGEAHDTSGINRDLNNTRKITKDQQTGGLDATVTVDHRLLSKEGRQDIKENFIDSAEHAQDIGRAVDTVTDSGNDLNLLHFGEALHNNAQLTQLKNDLVRNPNNKQLLADLNSTDPDTKARAFKQVGQMAQEKFGLDPSQIHLYDGSKTSSSSLGDSALADVKGGIVTDKNSAQHGQIFLDGQGHSSDKDLVQTLGHEVAENKTLQGKDRSLWGKNSESQQENMADAFGKQLSDRVSQAAGGGLDGRTDFSGSRAIKQGTSQANRVGNAQVDHRQLYTAEARAILERAPDYAKKYNISDEQAKRELTRQALRQVDKKWSQQDHIKENPRARTELASIGKKLGQVSESPFDRNIIDRLVDTDSSEPFQAKDDATFNDTNINAKEVRNIESGIAGEPNMIARYGTKDGRKPVSISTGEAAEAAGNKLKGIAEHVANDPVQMAKDTANGLYQGAKDTLKHPEKLVLSDSKGNAADQQRVAELQGDKKAARQAAGDNFIEQVSSFVPPVGKAAKGAIGEVVDEAARQAAKKGGVPKAPNNNTGSTTQPWKYDNRTEVTTRTADDVNTDFVKEGWQPPYKLGTKVTEYTTKADDQFVRVHGEGGGPGGWMMRKEAINGLTPEQIQRKYSLPSKPSHVSDVNVPAGTRIRTGKVETNFELNGGGGQGATQYQLLEPIPPESFVNPRSLVGG